MNWGHISAFDIWQTWQQAGVSGGARTVWNYDSVSGLLTSKRCADNAGLTY
jgi:hypothetical protein